MVIWLVVGLFIFVVYCLILGVGFGWLVVCVLDRLLVLVLSCLGLVVC